MSPAVRQLVEADLTPGEARERGVQASEYCRSIITTANEIWKLLQSGEHKPMLEAELKEVDNTLDNILEALHDGVY